jgi:hypothetical protein
MAEPCALFGHVYVAFAHKRLMAVESDEVIYVAGDAADVLVPYLQAEGSASRRLALTGKRT